MQQNPRSNIMSILLWTAVLFLGYNLFIAGPNKAPTKTFEELKAEMQANNAKILDQTISLRTYPDYIKSIDRNEKLSPEEKDRLKLEGLVLVADTQYKAAIQRQDINRVVTTNDALQSWERKLGPENKLWNTPVAVASHKDFPASSITPKEIKEKVRQISSELGKNTPVWGFFPGYQLIDALVAMTGRNPMFSYALACLLLAVVVRAVVFPLTQKQIMFGRQMSQLSPLMNEIKEKYKRKDGKPLTLQEQQEMNQEMMGLYQQYGINPASGCFPLMLQMPLFLMIYQSMLHYRFEFENGLFLWINPGLSQSTNGFVAANLGQKDYILLTLYAISMVATSLLMPVSDPLNARQQRIMGVAISGIFGVMMFFWPVPSAFVLYWTFTNVLATAQSLYSYRLPVAPLQKKVSVAGGMIPGVMDGIVKNPPSKTGVPQRHQPKKKKK